MRRFLENRWFLFALRLALGGVFLYAGTTKVVNPQAFADSIATFKILPPQLINLVALGLPPFEILLGLMLISGWKARAASLAVAGLGIVFGLALGQALVRGLAVDCGCFGSGEPSALKTWASFGRAFLLLAASFWVFTRENVRFANETKLSHIKVLTLG
jgi:putative oxidoreductase